MRWTDGEGPPQAHLLSSCGLPAAQQPGTQAHTLQAAHRPSGCARLRPCLPLLLPPFPEGGGHVKLPNP